MTTMISRETFTGIPSVLPIRIIAEKRTRSLAGDLLHDMQNNGRRSVCLLGTLPSADRGESDRLSREGCCAPERWVGNG